MFIAYFLYGGVTICVFVVSSSPTDHFLIKFFLQMLLITKKILFLFFVLIFLIFWLIEPLFFLFKVLQSFRIYKLFLWIYKQLPVSVKTVGVFRVGWNFYFSNVCLIILGICVLYVLMIFCPKNIEYTISFYNVIWDLDPDYYMWLWDLDTPKIFQVVYLRTKLIFEYKQWVYLALCYGYTFIFHFFVIFTVSSVEERNRLLYHSFSIGSAAPLVSCVPPVWNTGCSGIGLLGVILFFFWTWHIIVHFKKTIMSIVRLLFPRMFDEYYSMVVEYPLFHLLPYLVALVCSFALYILVDVTILFIYKFF